MRPSGRAPDELRTVNITRRYTKHAEGSVLVEFGDTKVICTATVEDRPPPWMRGSGSGWVTAEYGMLPRSTGSRMGREAARGRQGGRTMEIQRLIGRSLRAALNLAALGERTLTIDCDVIQADGGTRTASITGGYVALVDAVRHMREKKLINTDPVYGHVASVSVGIFSGVPVLDLDYAEDSNCETDMNVVMNDAGAFIEVQGTAEGHAFRRDELDSMLDLAGHGIGQLIEAQRAALASNNAGKVREFNELLAGLALQVIPQGQLGVPEADETGLTFVENAILKARHAAQLTGRPAVADDSGLEVDALNGAPGIYSARYAGVGASDTANVDKLLQALSGVPNALRSARFRCLMVYMRHGEDPTPLICQGTWEGRVLEAPRGDNGFGYDPVFYVPSHDCSAAELAADTKNRLSHRGQALRCLIEALGH